MSKKILITGATGNVGARLVEALASRNTPFVAMVRSDVDANRLAARGIETVIGDFADPQSLKAAVEEVDRIFLMSPTMPAQVQLEGNLIDAARNARVEHIVKLSVLRADSQSGSTLLKWHGQVERLLEDSGIPFTFIRPSPFQQNLAPFFAQSVAQQGAIYAPAGEARMTWIDTRDIAEVAAVALTDGNRHAGLTYEITGPEALSYADIAGKLSGLLGKSVTYYPVSDAAACQAMAESGMPDFFTHALITLYHFYKQGGAERPTGLVEVITGRQPRTLDAYLEENLAAFKGE